MAALKDLFKNPTPVELELAERYSKLRAHGQRERNFEAFAQTGLPHRRVETWKYSDLRNSFSGAGDTATGDIPTDPFEKIEDRIVFEFAKGAFSKPSLPAGMRIIERPEGAAIAGAEEAPLAALAGALSSKGALLIEVTQSLAAPLHLVFKSSADMEFSHLVFVLREGVELSVFESHLSAGGFSSRVAEYRLEANAKLNRSIFQNAADNAVQVITGLVSLEKESEFKQSSLGFGSKLCRNETRVFKQGEAAKSEINSAYLLSADRHYDQTSHVRHSQLGCTTRQLCKGGVMDGGRAVFQGKFHVARAAQQTDAEMGHHALILENGGEVNAKPELEIYADDVQCAHGNTVGALDEDALFYMRQRGLAELDARALLTEAFILETLEAAPEAVQEVLAAEARNWLEQNL